MKKKITPSERRRMAARPYYAFLYSRNILKGRLPEDLEVVFSQDPHSAYLYAKHVVKGRLPDFLHAAMMIGEHESDQKPYVAQYLLEFAS